MIGLPEKNNKEYPFFEYQREIYDALEAHEHVWIKKAKGIGATTFIIRYLLWKIVSSHELDNKNIFIISGTKQEFANKVKERLEALFRRAYPNLRVKSKYTEAWIKSTWIKVFPSRNIQDMRGYIDVAYIFVDESDFFQPIEQDELESVIKAYEEKSHGQNILCSTPNKPDNLFYKIEYEKAFGKDYFHKIWLDYRKGLGKIYDDEFIMREMDQDYFLREYDLQYTGMKGNVFATTLIEQCKELMAQYEGVRFNQMSFHPVGVDFGYNISKCVVCIGEWDNERKILRIVKMDDFGEEPPTPSEVANRIFDYYVEYGANTHFFIDGSNRGSVNEIKRKFGESLTWDKPKSGEFHKNERIHPINFGTDHRELLRNMYILATKRKLAINTRYDKLLISMHSAIAEDFDLDKDETVNNDYLDACRLMTHGVQLK